MAQLKLSGLLSGFSGKVGGSIVGESAHGFFLRQNSFNKKPPSIAQANQRQYIGWLAQQWRNLSTSEKNSWIAEISNYPYTNKVGDTAYYTAFQLFMYINSGRLAVGLSVSTTPPTFTAWSTVTWDIVWSSATEYRIFFNNTTTTDDIVIQATKPLLNATGYNFSQLKEIGIISPAATSGVSDITSIYDARFDQVVNNYFPFSRVRTIDNTTGIPSPWSDAKKWILPS